MNMLNEELKAPKKPAGFPANRPAPTSRGPVIGRGGMGKVGKKSRINFRTGTR